MADVGSGSVPGSSGGLVRVFKPVTKTPLLVGGSRSPGNGILDISGRLVLNVEASEAYDRLAVAIPENEQVTAFGVDVEHGLVAVSVEKLGAAGSVAVRHTGSNVILHLGGVLEEYPLLRPKLRCKCQVIEGPGVDGKPSLLIGLGTAVPMRHTSRAGKADSAESSSPPASPEES